MKLRLLFIPRNRQKLKLRNRQLILVGVLFIALIGGIVAFIFQISKPEKSVAANGGNIFRSYQGLNFQKVVRTADGSFILSDGTNFIKMDSTGTVLWSKAVTSPYTMIITGLAQTMNGDVVSVCQSNDSTSYKIGVTRLGTDGTVKWFKVFTAQGSDFAYGISADNNNGVILTGGGCNISHYIMQIDQDGNANWMKNFAVAGTTGSAYKVLVDSGGNILMTGRITVGNNYYISLIKTDQYGNFIWGKEIADAQLPIVKAIVKTSDGGYVIAGTYISQTAAPSNNPFVVKFDQSGNIIWFERIGNSSIESINDLSPTSDGGAMVIGNIYVNEQENVNALLIRLDNEGNIVWQKSAGNAEFNGAGYDDAYSICSNNDGSYTVVGMAYWAFITKMDMNGNGFCYQTPVALTAQDVNCQASNAVYSQVPGQIFQSATITPGVNNIFVGAPYTCTSSTATAVQTVSPDKTSEISLFPNPNDGNFNLNYYLPIEGNGSLQIFDLTGRKLSDIELPSFTHSVSVHLSELPSGIYMYQVIQKNKILKQDKFIVTR